jgi:predicted amidophosphoribosyltransferase
MEPRAAFALSARSARACWRRAAWFCAEAGAAGSTCAAGAARICRGTTAPAALRAAARRGQDCPRCLAEAPPFSFAHAAFRYEFPVDRLLPRFKFHARPRLPGAAGHAAAWSLDPDAWPQALLPVPCIARGCARAVTTRRWNWRRRCRGRPACRCWPRACGGGGERARRPSWALARAVANVAGAFALAPGPPLPAHVALVDDVLTTGATAGECAHLLLDAGVERVDLWVVASAP